MSVCIQAILICQINLLKYHEQLGWLKVANEDLGNDCGYYLGKNIAFDASKSLNIWIQASWKFELFYLYSRL